MSSEHFPARPAVEPIPRSPMDDVVDAAVAGVADYCVVDVIDEARHLGRAAVGCSRRGVPGLVRALRATPPGAEPQLGVDVVAAGAGARMVPRLNADWMHGLEVADGQLELLEGRAPVAALVVPVPGGARPLGALTLLTLEPEGFPPRALEQAHGLARLAAAVVERARWKRAAAVAERARHEFLAVISHELRTPLTTIIGYADLLKTGMSGQLSEVQRDRVDRIGESAWSLVRQMEQILELVRAQSTDKQVRLDTIELATFTSGVAQIVEPIARGKGLEFRMRRPEVREELVTDPDKLRRALLNLLDNAVRYTRHGWIALAAEADNGRVRFEVKDSGVGIPSGERPLLFEPFWRGAHAEHAVAGSGMGLGLSLARQLLRQLDGEIRVDSQQGAGTTVTVELPRRLARAAGGSPSLGL